MLRGWRWTGVGKIIDQIGMTVACDYTVESLKQERTELSQEAASSGMIIDTLESSNEMAMFLVSTNHSAHLLTQS